MSRAKFTLEEGLLVQFNHLAIWKRKLNKKCFDALAAECLAQNKLLSDKDSGFQVFRGQSLDNFIANWKP